MKLSNLKLKAKLNVSFGLLITFLVLVGIVAFVALSFFQKVSDRVSGINSLKAVVENFRYDVRVVSETRDTANIKPLYNVIQTTQEEFAEFKKDLVSVENIKKVDEGLKFGDNLAASLRRLSTLYGQTDRIVNEMEKYADGVKIYKEKNINSTSKAIFQAFAEIVEVQSYIKQFANSDGEAQFKRNFEKHFANFEDIVTKNKINELIPYIELYKNKWEQLQKNIAEEKYLQNSSIEDTEKILAIANDAVSLIKNIQTKLIKICNILIIVIVFISLILSIVISSIMSRSLGSVVNKCLETVEEVSDGNLSVKFDRETLERKDEFGQLLQAMSNMVKKLHNLIGGIVEGASSIKDAGENMSNSSQMLSQGANEQASSIEEVSSSMEEMAANIHQNTDNAQQANSIASQITEGLNKVIDATQENFRKAKDISDKISIINDISSQTNILALNAAVEAARAGEHGRGFAVVASEVRKLAERSKTAADEIISLANGSLVVVEDAGKKLHAILPDILKTIQLVKEIAAASMEQNEGANQINNAIQQLNQIAQQNAAASEEIATNAEELSSQADQMASITNVFKI